MKIKRILVLYKKSTLDISQRRLKTVKNKGRVLKAINKAHDDHYRSLEILKNSLAEIDMPVQYFQRGKKKLPGARRDDLVISLGGDGTFIYTSHSIEQSLLLGVNSAPDSSVGFYCPINVFDKKSGLKNLVEKVISGEGKVELFQRLSVKINNKVVPVPVLNDILITETNPAITSRYQLELDGHRENQKSSGIWVSTASGSTAAYSSAGGRPFKAYNKGEERQFGFIVRELYREKGINLKQALVSEKQKFSVLSTMTAGKIFFDGGYKSINLSLGDKISIQFYKYPLRVIQG